jgi:hypothetical protein
MNCRNCGNPLKPGDLFCTNCGLPVTSADFEGATVAAPAASLGGPPPDFSEPVRSGSAASGAAPISKLVALTGDNIGQEITLDKPENVVGRMPDCDVVIDDARVSRRHAAIRYSAGEFMIQDLGSANGTLVNDDMITEPTELHDGDIINLGVVSFLFRIEEPVEDIMPPVAASSVPVEPMGGLRGRLSQSPSGEAATQFAATGFEEQDRSGQAGAFDEQDQETQYAPPEMEGAPTGAGAEPPADNLSDSRLASLLSVEPDEAAEPPAAWADLLSAPEDARDAGAQGPPPVPVATRARADTEQEDAEVVEAFSGMEQTLNLLRESFDSSRQTVDTLQNALTDLRTRLDTARSDASAAHAEIDELNQRVQTLDQERRRQKEQIGAPIAQLREVGGAPNKDYRSLIKVIEDLAADPRDIELLAALGRHRDSILELIRFQETAKQRVNEAVATLETAGG